MSPTYSILKDDDLLIQRVYAARTHGERMKGLLGRDSLPVGEGLWIESCSAIHTFGMRFSIDVIFLDESYRIAKVCPDVKPGRAAMGGLKARSVIEVTAGWLDLTGLDVGDTLSFQERDP